MQAHAAAWGAHGRRAGQQIEQVSNGVSLRVTAVLEKVNLEGDGESRGREEREGESRGKELGAGESRESPPPRRGSSRCPGAMVHGLP